MKVALLNQLHPSHDAVLFAELRALHEGGKRWRALIETWLPQNAQEPSDLYEDRKARAVYHNHLGAILGMFVGNLFSEAPAVDGGGERMAALVDDVDGGGTSLGAWFRERFEDALVAGRAWAWVNLPARPEDAPEPANLGEEEAAGLLDAYLVGPTPEQVLDWGTDAHGKLTWAIVRDIVEVRASVEDTRAPVWRWTSTAPRAPSPGWRAAPTPTGSLPSSPSRPARCRSARCATTSSGR